MRSESRLLCVASSAAVVMGFAANTAHAKYAYTFDNAASFTTIESGFSYAPAVPNFRFDYGTAAGSATHGAAFTSVNGDGAVQITEGFNFAANGAGGNAYTIDLFSSPSPANITNLSFDIRLDRTSAKDAFNGAGYFQVSARNDGYTSTDSGYSEEFGNPSYNAPTTGTYEHISIPLTGGLQNIRALTLQLYNSADRHINGNVVFDLDNLVLTQSTDATPEPAAVGVLGVSAGTLLRRKRR